MPFVDHLVAFELIICANSTETSKINQGKASNSPGQGLDYLQVRLIGPLPILLD